MWLQSHKTLSPFLRQLTRSAQHFQTGAPAASSPRRPQIHQLFAVTSACMSAERTGVGVRRLALQALVTRLLALIGYRFAAGAMFLGSPFGPSVQKRRYRLSTVVASVPIRRYQVNTP